MDNQHALRQAHHLLNTPEGDSLLSELGEFWNPTQMFDVNPNQMAYNAGLRDAYMFLMAMQSGELIDDG